MKMTRRESLLYNAELYALNDHEATWSDITDNQYETYVGSYEWIAKLSHDKKSWFILFLLAATK